MIHRTVPLGIAWNIEGRDLTISHARIESEAVVHNDLLLSDKVGTPTHILSWLPHPRRFPRWETTPEMIMLGTDQSVAIAKGLWSQPKIFKKPDVITLYYNVSTSRYHTSAIGNTTRTVTDVGGR